LKSTGDFYFTIRGNLKCHFGLLNRDNFNPNGHFLMNEIPYYFSSKKSGFLQGKSTDFYLL